jgi:AcrR family transcriptional regulator
LVTEYGLNRQSISFRDWLYFIPSGWYIISMAQRSDGQATRERLLIAAAKLVAADGPSALTLDRAAVAAGISKGAVLYHFKSKDALVEALLSTVLGQFDVATDVVVKRDTNSAGSYARAYAKVTFDPRNNTPEATAGLLAAVTTNIDLLKPAAERHAEIQRRLEADGISPTLATLVRLATDGLYFSRAFRLAPLKDTEAAEVLKLLLQLVADQPRPRRAGEK